MEETEICVSEVMPLVLQVIDGGSEIGVLQATSVIRVTTSGSGCAKTIFLIVSHAAVYDMIIWLTIQVSFNIKILQ